MGILAHEEARTRRILNATADDLIAEGLQTDAMNLFVNVALSRLFGPGQDSEKISVRDAIIANWSPEDDETDDDLVTRILDDAQEV